MYNKEEELIKLHMAVESSDEAIFITDLQGIITNINPAFTRLYGFTAIEVLGKVTPRIIKSGVLSNEAYESFWKSILNKEVVRGELINKTKEGRLVSIESLTNPILNSDGNIIGFIGIQHDITDKKIFEENLKQNEELFRKAFLTSPDAVNINRFSDGMYVSVNEGFTKILGFTQDDVLGKTSSELNIWADLSERDRLLTILKEKGSVEGFESEFRKKDGGVVVGLMSASMIDYNGVPHILNETKDITLQKKMAESLNREQFLFNAIMDYIPDHIYFKDRDSRFLRVNKSLSMKFGIEDPSQLIGKSDFDFFSEDHARQAYDDEREIMRTEKVLSKVEKETHPAGPDTWVSTVKLPLYDKDSKLIGTFGISRDITEQKKSEEQLFLLANALKSTNECVSITDINDKVLFLNQAFINTYGFNENDLADKNIDKIRSPNNSEAVMEEILPSTLTGGWHGEVLNRRKDGSEFPIALSTAVVKDELGNPVALIGVASDITQRRKTEEALRQSEERFRSVAKTANDAIITTDSDGVILGWNYASEKAFQYSENEVIGLRLEMIIPAEYLKRHIDGMFRVKHDGARHAIGRTVELNGRRKDGSEFPIELSLSEWDSSEGKFFTAIIRDITKRKRTESENEVIYEITRGITTTSKLDELLEHIHKSLAKVVYADNCFIALHDDTTGLFSFPYFVDKIDQKPSPMAMGKSYSAYVYRTVKPFLHSDAEFDRLKSLGEVELVGSASPSWIGIPLQTPSKVIGVLVLQHYDKSNVYTDEDLRFLQSIGGQIAFAIERKQAESALQESEKNLHDSQKIAGLGSYVLDFKTGNWTSSEILDSLFGIDEAYDRSVHGWINLIHPEWQQIMSDYLEKEVISSHKKFDKEYKIVRFGDKCERWVHGQGELLFDDNGAPGKMIGSILDITERKKSEEEIRMKNELLQATNAEKDKFFSIIAHDLRGPMSAFVEVTKILADDIQSMSPEETREILLSMRDDSANVYSLLENLLEWSRLKRGTMEFVPQELNIKNYVEESIKVLSETAFKKQIKIVVQVEADLNAIADRRMFQTIIRNLVSNALKFTKTGGTVTVRAERSDNNSIIIYVIDTGIGMPEELKNRLFQLNEKTSRPGTGGEPSSGLGLLLCKEFVEKHGGKIWVDSIENTGSTFSFILP